MQTQETRLANAKLFAMSGDIGARDYGYFELIKLLAAGQGDREAFWILLNARTDFYPAVKTEFNTQVQAFGQQFSPTYKPGTSQLVLAYGGRSHTFYLDVGPVVVNRKAMESARNARRAKRLEQRPEGRKEPLTNLGHGGKRSKSA